MKVGPLQFCEENYIVLLHERYNNNNKGLWVRMRTLLTSGGVQRRLLTHGSIQMNTDYRFINGFAFAATAYLTALVFECKGLQGLGKFYQNGSLELMC